MKRVYLTKGELAEMMGIPKSQIRFYEIKGLLKPMEDTNGYSLYSNNEIFRLEFILFLRSIDKSVEEISTILSEGSKYDYLEMLNDAEKNTKNKIKQLRNKIKEIKYKRSYYEKSIPNTFDIQFINERDVNIIDINIGKLYPKEIFEILKKYNVDYRDFENELCEVLVDDTMYNGLINPKINVKSKDVSKYHLKEGYYCCYSFGHSKRGDYQKFMDIFNKKCAETGYDFDKETLFISYYGKPYYSKESQILSFQRRIKNDFIEMKSVERTKL